MKEALRNMNLKKGKTFILPNSIDTELFTYKEKQFHKIKAISLRNFLPKYGLHLSIAAMNDFDFIYDIYGSGAIADEHRLQRLIKKNTTIHNMRIPHIMIPKLYSDYNIFIAPSLEEAQGISMMEAMSTGMIVVASNVGGIPEFIEDGNDGIMATPTIQGIKDGIKRYLAMNETRKKEMSIKAREKAEKYGKEIVINREIEILNSITTK
jgi:glycosyltransferase involved in cell wall biosynthesis